MSKESNSLNYILGAILIISFIFINVYGCYHWDDYRGPEIGIRHGD